MKKPKRTTKEMIRCFVCNKAIHINDLAGFTKSGLVHKQCLFQIVMQGKDGFITGYEAKCKKKLEAEGGEK